MHVQIESKIKEVDFLIRLNRWFVENGRQIDPQLNVENHKKRIDELLDKRLELMKNANILTVSSHTE